ncbi:TPM domain-containing protein [Tenacibaculum ovolyticum]|uniref:TPM domain-containing protein n=1 Tax=Tenacibaculum ovolyticum TaxID=104270 RepID=UPI0007EE158F|nr:TPM domain-containing protein [Tenacibaculum ovolyticum]
MKIDTKVVIIFLALSLLSLKGIAQETDSKKTLFEFNLSTVKKFKETKLNGQIVNDYDSIFSPSQRKELSNIIYNYNIKTTRQIVVVTINSIHPYTDIQKMATALGKYWRVGTTEKDNGLIILLCKPCKQISIATGIGTKLILTDKVCKETVDKTIIPLFKHGEFYNGVKTGMIELIKKWK